MPIEKINGRSMLDVTDILEGRAVMILNKDIVVMSHAHYVKIRHGRDAAEDISACLKARSKIQIEEQKLCGSSVKVGNIRLRGFQSDDYGEH